MKKTISAIILAALAITACNNEKLNVSEPYQDNKDNAELKFDLIITRADQTGTKATLKADFADNDVVFIFFSGAESPKYVEAKYSAGSSSWAFTAKNGLTSSELESAGTKQMTAIYLPYGSGFTVSDESGKFLLNGEDGYKGYFLNAEKQDYTVVSGTLTGTLSLAAPALASGEQYIQFDVQGFTSGHNYDMRQQYVKPISLGYVASDGTVSMTEGIAGTAIVGYEYNNGVNNLMFSGALTSSAVGNAVDYHFTICDQTDKIFHYRYAGTKTLSESKYIGLGNISASIWNSLEFVDLGLPSGTLWANCNLGTSTEIGYGDYYAWGETTPYYEVGYAQENPQSHWKAGKTGYNWASNSLANGNYYKLIKYCPTEKTGYWDGGGSPDNKLELESEDDAAAIALNGLGRIPTKADIEELLNSSYCTWSWQTDYNSTGVNGYLVTSISNSATIFLPAAGCRDDTNLQYSGTCGYYWSSSLYTDYPERAWYLYLDSDKHNMNNYGNRYYGHSVRPVCVLP